jgi:integrase/recombinase XerD
MLSELFDSSGRIHALRAGPAGASLDGFAQALVDAGYAQITARRHLRAAEHFVSLGRSTRPVGEQSHRGRA